MRKILLSIFLLLAVSVSAQDFQGFVNRLLQTYPKSRLLDIYKSCFQDYMGAEHLVSDKQIVKAYLDEELSTTSFEDLMPWYYEPCGVDSNYYRVSIRAVKEGLIPEDKLLDAFIRSANAETHPSVASWNNRWHKMMGIIDQMRLNLPRYEEDKQYIDSVLAIGKYAISHSPDYHEAYHPHYRIVERSIFDKEIRPLLAMPSTVTPPQQDSTVVNLKNVVVAARAIEKSVSAERTRINLAASMSAATGSVLEVLRSSSAVTIDGNSQVSIRGNSNVLILIDGVPTTLDGLGSIPAANVQSIDIVTSPDAKYDAEGSGGIINIVSKKQTPEAFTAMASANYGINNFMNGNVAMSYNFGRWGIRMNYNGKWERDHVESELHRRIVQTGSTLDQMIDAAKKTTGHNIGLNVSYKATKQDVLTLDVKAGFPRMNNLQTMHNHYGNADITSEKLRQTDITFNREMVEGSLGYRHLFEPGRREVSIMASLSGINGHRPSYYYEQVGAASALEMVQRSESGGRPRIAALQLDYMTPLGRGKLETGVKMTYRQNHIDHQMYEHDAATDTWQLSVPLSNDLRHREYIPAAYAMYSSKLTGQLTMKAGLRLEYSRVTLQSDKERFHAAESRGQTYLDYAEARERSDEIQRLDEASNCYFVAPNLMLNYRVSEPWQLSLGLSRRISRPTYPQLNPYINLIDNQTYETGNIHLKPEKANKLDLGYTYTGQTLKVSGNAYLNYTQDYINQITHLDNNILVMTYINGEMDLKTGIEHNIRWSALRWLGIDLGSNIFYTHSRADWNGTAIRNQGWTTNTSATLNIMPLRGMTIQAQYFVTTPQYFPQFTTKTIHYCNLGIRQQLPKTSLTLSALVTDVFNTRRWDISSDNPVYTLTNTSRNRSRVLWLGLTWNFHSYKPLGGTKKQQEEDRSVIRLGE